MKMTVEPQSWKALESHRSRTGCVEGEGLDQREDCEKIVAAARQGGKVGCIILGRGEDEMKVREWLTTAAGV